MPRPDHLPRIRRIVRARWLVRTVPANSSVPTLVQAVGDRVDIDRLPLDIPLVSAPRRLIFIGSEAALVANDVQQLSHRSTTKQLISRPRIRYEGTYGQPNPRRGREFLDEGALPRLSV